MTTNRSVLYFFLLLLFLLIAGFMLLSRSGVEKPASALASARPASDYGARSASARPSHRDFTFMADPENNADMTFDRPASASFYPGNDGRRVPAHYEYGDHSLSGASAYPPSGRGVLHSARPYSGASASPSVTQRRAAAARRTPARTAYSTGRRVSSAGGFVGGNAVYDEEEREISAARSRLLDAYAPRRTREQQQALDLKLNRMSSGIERAIARAMAPKSKREQNIEKYMSARGEAAQTDGDPSAAHEGALSAPAREVRRQIASQAAGVVNDVRANYGSAAAGRAGKIMDNFQKEMTDVLNTPGDPQEKQIRAAAVNNKYNRQLQDLNREESLRKMENQLRQENEKQLAQIREKFNPQTEAAARVKMEENLQKRMQIIGSGQSDEEAYKQMLALNEQQRKDLEEIVRSSNPDDPAAAAKLLELQNEEAKKRILEESQAAKEGRRSAGRYRETEEKRQARNESEKREGEQIVKSFEAFGPQVQDQARQILADLQTRRNEIYAESEDLNELNSRNMEATEEANRQLRQLRTQNADTLRQNIQQQLDSQNPQVLRQYTDQMKGVPEEAKKAWSAQAEPVLKKYNARRAEIAASVKDPKEYEAAMKDLAQQELRELNAIGQAAPEAEQ